MPWLAMKLLHQVDRRLLQTFTTLVLITAASKAEYDMWVKGLEILVQDTVKSSYPLQVERFVVLFVLFQSIFIARSFWPRVKIVRE